VARQIFFDKHEQQQAFSEGQNKLPEGNAQPMSTAGAETTAS
jgi:hypothetical protein